MVYVIITEAEFRFLYAICTLTLLSVFVEQQIADQWITDTNCWKDNKGRLKWS